MLRIFITLFIAMGGPLALPSFVQLTESQSMTARRRMGDEAVFVAGVVGLLFLLIGEGLFRLLGITENDFRIGGGLVLLAISVYAMVSRPAETPPRAEGAVSGAVPLGVPLIMGPAAITTILLTARAYGFALTSLAVAANLAVVWLSFRQVRAIIRSVGIRNLRIASKVAALLLCSMAVAMIRVGISRILAP